MTLYSQSYTLKGLAICGVWVQAPDAGVFWGFRWGLLLMHLLDLPVLLLHSLQGQVPHVSLQSRVCVARSLLVTEIGRIQGQWGNGRWRGLVSRSPGKISFQKHQVANHGTFQLGPGGQPGVQTPQVGVSRRGQRAWALISTLFPIRGPDKSHASVSSFLKWEE